MTFTAPPQVNHIWMYRLANYHFRAFFYWTTFQKESNLGGFVQGGFFPLAVVPRSDWGAARVRWFMSLVHCVIEKAPGLVFNEMHGKDEPDRA